MILTSSFILNEVQEANSLSIAPNIHSFVNSLTERELYQEVSIPDVCPSNHIPEGVDFSMATGEFLIVYKEDFECWDAVVTCFFIDTAHNVLDYLEKIWEMLKPGGLWINIGPLLYHYSDSPGEQSIELTWDQLKHFSQEQGFVFEVRISQKKI